MKADLKSDSNEVRVIRSDHLMEEICRAQAGRASVPALDSAAPLAGRDRRRTGCVLSEAFVDASLDAAWRDVPRGAARERLLLDLTGCLDAGL